MTPHPVHPGTLTGSSNPAGTQTPLDSAQEELIVAHMPLVSHIARETMMRVPTHVNRDDLSSAGLTALVKAARGFDASRGVPFNRYAATRIRGAMVDELRQTDWASRSVRRRGRELDEERSRLATALGRPATADEVASAMRIDRAEVDSIDESVARAQVLSFDGGGESNLAEMVVSDTPTPADLVEHRERLEYLVEAIAELPERQRIVIEDYFLAERPMAETAARLGVSESRVSQIRAEALVLLRDALNHALDPELVQPASRPDGCAAQRRATYVQAVAARHASARRPAPRAGGPTLHALAN